MIVEDSLVVRRLLSHIVMRDPRLHLIAAVASAEDALQELPRLRPDVISMDIRLPGIDGLEATRRIMSEQPTPIVVIADSVEDSALRISMNALRAGALSVVEKPVGTETDGYERIAETICTQLFIMSQVPVIRRRGPGISRPPLPPPSALLPRTRPSVLAIAASTGGPPALAQVLGALPADYPLPVLLVQHMGSPFLEGFAAWLDGLVPMRVRLARDGERPRPGEVYVAPGERHLLMAPGGVLRLSAEPPLASQRPSATRLFQSVAETAGAQGLGVLLTGMGEDGAAGLLAMRQAGALTLTEHESTAVVYGMPAAAVRMGGSLLTLPLPLIGPHLLAVVREAIA
ncbi:chemotaxis-specific protein-glutamate methyltransferase CheB [Roseomonas vastitatis]|uniref:Protein-glutamate methylesterase/protein-glutamine glutaminase n=1 Tax=Teichococcus vastitatis TaxID=2307076 RepID=A0ABS9WB53_9PROT|nr:chemotaxis-specific protein-glutamate methyltransferase CheB [Pseudoroseomonas vastitatis]MCI0755985.1 chemotaxis-specific protein-glutamate methyltransferase CheB [Pseudoroseomonas vastitatis]